MRRDARADRRGAAARRRGALVVSPYYSRAAAGRAVRTGTATRRRASSRTCRSSSTTSRSAPRVEIAPATVGRLRRAHENIVGIKETTRDFEHVSYVLNECGTRLHRAVGDRAALLPDARARRRAGTSAASANFAPRPSPSSTTPSSPATTSARATLHYDLHPLVDAAFAEVNPVPGEVDHARARRHAVGVRARAARAAQREHRSRRSASCCRSRTRRAA